MILNCLRALPGGFTSQPMHELHGVVSCWGRVHFSTVKNSGDSWVHFDEGEISKSRDWIGVAKDFVARRLRPVLLCYEASDTFVLSSQMIPLVEFEQLKSLAVQQEASLQSSDCTLAFGRSTTPLRPEPFEVSLEPLKISQLKDLGEDSPEPNSFMSSKGNSLKLKSKINLSASSYELPTDTRLATDESKSIDKWECEECSELNFVGTHKCVKCTAVNWKQFYSPLHQLPQEAVFLSPSQSQESISIAPEVNAFATERYCSYCDKRPIHRWGMCSECLRDFKRKGENSSCLHGSSIVSPSSHRCLHGSKENTSSKLIKRTKSKKRFKKKSVSGWSCKSCTRSNEDFRVRCKGCLELRLKPKQKVKPWLVSSKSSKLRGSHQALF